MEGAAAAVLHRPCLVDYETIKFDHHLMLNESPWDSNEHKEMLDALGKAQFVRNDCVWLGITTSPKNGDLLQVSKATYDHQKLVHAIVGSAKKYVQQSFTKRFDFSTIKLLPPSEDLKELALDGFTGPVMIGTIGCGEGVQS